jgi:hypothetical protein
MTKLSEFFEKIEIQNSEIKATVNVLKAKTFFSSCLVCGKKITKSFTDSGHEFYFEPETKTIHPIHKPNEYALALQRKKDAEREEKRQKENERKREWYHKHKDEKKPENKTDLA